MQPDDVVADHGAALATPAGPSVIIPAHDEQGRVGPLLDLLLAGGHGHDLEIVVVCNGCTDGTADEARQRRGVHVIELDKPSKDAALRVGDAAATRFPRLYVDADVQLGASDVWALAAALIDNAPRAAAPMRLVDLSSASRAVRLYYRVWFELPAVKEGLFGRGVIGVNRSAHELLTDRPVVVNDDLFVHLALDPLGRRIVAEAFVRIAAPTGLRALVRRRVRTAAGNRELGEVSAAGSRRQLLHLLQQGYHWWPPVTVFILVTLTARLRAEARRLSGREVTWGRDVSSRTGS